MIVDNEYKWMYNWLKSRSNQLYNNAVQNYKPFYDRDISALIKQVFSNPTSISASYLRNQFGDLNQTEEYGYGRRGLQNPEKVRPLLIRNLNKSSNGDYNKYNTRTLMDFNSYMYDGMTFPNNKIVYFSNPSNSTVVHERTHALYAYPQQQAVDYYLQTNPNIDQDRYLDDPSEVYSRLMEFRYNNKLKPNQKVTKENLNQWRKNKSIKDKHLLNRYTDESLLHLFNDVALNDTKYTDLNDKA